MKAHYAVYSWFVWWFTLLWSFKGQQNLTPVYTDDAVYKELIKELEEARALIQNPSATAQGVATDVVFSGDMNKLNLLTQSNFEFFWDKASLQMQQQ
jgi:hypothetical protein